MRLDVRRSCARRRRALVLTRLLCLLRYVTGVAADILVRGLGTAPTQGTEHVRTTGAQHLLACYMWRYDASRGQLNASANVLSSTGTEPWTRGR